MTNVVRYAGENPRIFSPGLWGSVHQIRADQDMGKCKLFEDDFDRVATWASATEELGYNTYQDTGVTIKGIPDIDVTELEAGLVQIAGNDADNDEGHIQSAIGNEAVLSDTADQDFPVLFECRLKKASIADNALAFAVGLGEESFAAANGLVDDTGALADKDFIGFQVLQDNGEELDILWRKSGGAVTNPTDGTNVLSGGVVADTYLTLGFRYQPQHPDSSKRIAFFVNGAELNVYATDTNFDAATFPDGEELSRVLLTKVGAAAEVKVHLDWWAVCQYFCHKDDVGQ